MRIVVLRGNHLTSDSRVLKECHALRKAGHHVHFLGWHFGNDKRPLPRALAASATHMHLRGHRGSWKLLAALPIWWTWLTWQLLRRDWDAVHACDLDTLPPAVLAGRLRRRRIVHDVFDYYPDMLAGNVPTPILGGLRRFYAFLLRRVDAVIIADAARATQIEPRVPDEVVMNCPEDAGAPTPPGGANGGALRVFYAGAITRGRGVFTLLDAVADTPGIRVEIAGYGTDLAEVQARCEKLPNVTFLGRLPYDEVLARSRAADALFAFYDPANPNNRLASPNKLYEAMMLGRPLVTCSGTLAATTAEDVGIGVVVPFGDAEALRAAFLDLAAHPERRAKMGELGRHAYEQRYNWAEMETRLANLYDRLATHPRRRSRASAEAPQARTMGRG